MADCAFFVGQFVIVRNVAEAKRILVLAPTAGDAERIRDAAEKFALEMILGCADDSGAFRLDFSTRDSALHTVEFIHGNPVAAMVPITDAIAPTVARAASMVGLPFHPPKAADACASKSLLHRKLKGAGLSTDDKAGFTVECVMRDRKLRVLAVAEVSDEPRLLSAYPAEFQQGVIGLLKKVVTIFGLKHGPVRLEVSNSLAVVDLSLSYARTRPIDALHFRIPLVDLDISYEEVLVRNALDLDISRVQLGV